MGIVSSYFSGPPRPVRYGLISWGNNEYGQAGPDKAPLGQANFVVTAGAGVNHSLAVTSLGEVFAWGCNVFGQLGNGSINSESHKDAITLPFQVTIRELAVPVKVRKVSAGQGHSAAVTESGHLYTWGLGSDGQLCYECTVSNTFVIPFTKERCQLTPKRVDSLLKVHTESVACGKNFTLILTSEHRVYVSGSGRYGVLGNGKLGNQHEPVQVALPGRVTHIAAGWSHCLAAVQKIGVFMWGQPYLDLEFDTMMITEPGLVLNTDQREEIASLACGQNHSAAVVANLEGRTGVWTWGANGHGQLGYGTEDDLSIEPRLVAALFDCDIHTVTCGWNYTASLVNDGHVMAWGGNKYYQFGEDKDVSVPSFLSLDCQIEDIISGYSHILFLTVSQSVKQQEKRLASTGWSSGDKMISEDFFPKLET